MKKELLVLKCSNCAGEFSRNLPQAKRKRTTSCSYCGFKIIILDSILTGEDKSRVLKENCQKKIIKNEKIMACVKNMPGIKMSQIPVSQSEALFKKRAAEKGYVVHRPSWPDFILEKDGKLFFVEVKSRTDQASKNQKSTFHLLKKHGFPVYLWKNSKEKRDKLTVWND